MSSRVSGPTTSIWSSCTTRSRSPSCCTRRRWASPSVARRTRRVATGQFDRDGRVAVSPSGGLLSRGHPVGATGVAQICESYWQLTEQAGASAGSRCPGGAHACDRRRHLRCRQRRLRGPHPQQPVGEAMSEIDDAAPHAVVLSHGDEAVTAAVVRTLEHDGWKSTSREAPRGPRPTRCRSTTDR